MINSFLQSGASKYEYNQLTSIYPVSMAIIPCSESINKKKKWKKGIADFPKISNPKSGFASLFGISSRLFYHVSGFK